MTSNLEYVQPTKTRKGYWRRVRYDRVLPSRHQRRVRSLLSKSAFNARGSFGKAEIVKDDEVKTVPKIAQIIQSELKGVRVAPEKPRMVSDFVVADLEAIRRIAEALREIKELGS